MRILQLIQSRNFAGSEQSVLTLSRELSRQGQDVFIAAKSGGILRDTYEKNGLTVLPVNLGGLLTFGKLSALCKEHSIQVVHTHLTGAARIGLRLHRKLGLPVVGHLRILRNAPVFHQIAQTGRLIANSAVTADYYRNECGLKCVEGMVTIPNSTDIHRSPQASIQRAEAKAALRAELGLSEESMLLLHAGRITRSKGQDIVVKALPDILQEHPHVHLILAGSGKRKGTFTSELKALVKSLGLSDRVHFLGFRTDVARLVMAADLQVVPSLNEPFGLVVIEAMILGTPLVGSTTGAIPSILDGGELGYLAETGNPSKWAETINKALKNSETTSRLADKARTIALQKYTPETMTRQVIEVYEDLLSAQCPSPK